MAESKHTLSDLHQMQSLPLSAKIRMTKQRIKWWVDEFGEDGVYISFSGGKDSTVLLHMARQEFPNLKAAYADTGLEFPEIKAFVRTCTNVDILKPKMSFPKVVEKYGFPLISKEVSECVSGARKYLTAVEAEMNAVDRQTDRQTAVQSAHKWHWQKYRQLTGIGEYSKFSTTPSGNSRGGQRRIWSAIQYAEKHGIGSGGSVRDFANLVGVRTAQNTIDARLWQNNKQLPSSKDAGDSSDRGNGNDGDYP